MNFRYSGRVRNDEPAVDAVFAFLAPLAEGVDLVQPGPPGRERRLVAAWADLLQRNGPLLIARARSPPP